MAENASQPQQAPAAPPTAAVSGGRKLFWMVVATVMAVEGVGVFFLAKALSGAPAAAVAGEANSAHGSSPETHSPADRHEATDHAPATGGHDSGHGSAKKDEHGAGSHAATSGAVVEAMADAFAEVKLAECKTFNKETGKLVLFHIRVSVLVKMMDAERVRKTVEARQARIDDRVNTIIRSAEPRHLNEPGLETLKRRLKFELDRIFGDPRLVHEVLIPYLVQSGSGL
jgi:flagellar basal body-associated protein FliL